MQGHHNSYWFILKSDGYEGPLHDEEFQTRIHSGEVSPSTLIWTKGMSQWSRYADFIGDKNPDEANVIVTDVLQQIQSPPTANAALSAATAGSGENHFKQLDINELVNSIVESNTQSIEKHFLPKKHMRIWAGLAGVLAIAAVAVVWTLSSMRPEKVSDRIPVGMFTPIDAKQLSEASKSNNVNTAFIARALYGNVFAIAYGSPQVHEVLIRVQNVPKTLLNRMHFSVEAVLKLDSGITFTEDLGTVAKGFYDVSVFTKDAKIKLGSARFFLGGLNDQQYQSELAVYLGKVAAQETLEKEELKEYLTTLKRVSSEAVEVYAQFLKTYNRRPWGDFSKESQTLVEAVVKANTTRLDMERVLESQYNNMAEAGVRLQSYIYRMDQVIRSGAESSVDAAELEKRRLSFETLLQDLEKNI